MESPKDWTQDGRVKGPPLMSTPKSQLTAEQLLIKKDWNLPKKIFYIQRHKEETMTW